MTNSDPENMTQVDAVKSEVWDYAVSRPPASPETVTSREGGEGEESCVVEEMMTPVEALTATMMEDVQADGGDSAVDPARTRSGGLRNEAKTEVRHGFRVGDLQLMIRYEDSSSLSELYVVHRLPNAPEWFNGITNLRGKLIPVFDLAGYMGLEHRIQKKEMLLVLGHGNDAVGILIDGLLERLRLTDEEGGNMDAAPARLTSHLRSAIQIDGKIWYDLDVQSLIGDLEHALEGFS